MRVKTGTKAPASTMLREGCGPVGREPAAVLHGFYRVLW